MTLSTTEARDRFSEVVNRSAFGGERVRLARHGKEVAAVIPIEDLLLLERLVEEEEDRIDLEEARKALADPEPSIPYEQARQELGL